MSAEAFIQTHVNIKSRRLIIWSVAIIVLLMALAVWFGSKRPSATPMAVSTQVNTAAIPASSNLAATPTGTSAYNQKRGLSALNDVPIIFYGRLEDQLGSPVANAQIAASIRIYNGVQSTVKRFSVVSDANGFFQVNEGKGESLGLMPHKAGYALASTETEFKYSFMYNDHFTPDKNNPTVIKMWKLEGAEPLLGIDKDYKLHYTEEPINFDFITGKTVLNGGDMKIKISRPEGIVSQRNPQDWSIEIEAVEGGLIETSVGASRVAFIAPENAYQPRDNLAMQTNNHWSDVFDQSFYIMSRKGQIYSKLRLTIAINDTPDGFVYIKFTGVANTNGSRNWEATAPQ